MVPATTSSADVLVEPVVFTEHDIPWAFDLAQRRYPDHFDIVTAEGWIRNVVLKQPIVFYPCRMPHAFCVSMMSITPWLPSEVECNIVLIVAEEQCMWEGMKCLRSSINWARSRGCKVWRISSDTEYDLCMMAKRLGAKEIAPRYVLRL